MSQGPPDQLLLGSGSKRFVVEDERLCHPNNLIDEFARLAFSFANCDHVGRQISKSVLQGGLDIVS